MTTPESVATLHTAAGTPTEVPAHPLSLIEAKICRVYAAWLARRDLESRIFCPSCLPSREGGGMIACDAEKVGWTCGHGMWFGSCPSATALTTTHTRQESSPLLLSLPHLEEVTLGQDEARLLQAYRGVLQAQHLREALYCLTCFIRNQDDGLRAFVTPRTIQLECRHRRMTYQAIR